MTDAVLIDLAVKVDRRSRSCSSTPATTSPRPSRRSNVRRRYGLNLRMMTVARHDEALWQVDPENCCSAVKVGQLDRALAGKAGVDERAAPGEAASRGHAPIVARDLRGLVKINPIATWSDLDVAGYIADHDVPVNPLVAQGYPSIGCMPCTQPVEPATTPARAAGRPRQDGVRPAPVGAQCRGPRTGPRAIRLGFVDPHGCDSPRFR